MLKLLNNFFKIKSIKSNEKSKKFNISQIKKGNKIELSRHYPSSTEYWYNSIYSFNRNKEKSILPLDLIVNNFIKMYFNLISSIDKNSRFERRRNRTRYYSTNRIFVSRADIKHYNDKVIITVFTYNRIKKYYTNKLFNLYKTVFNFNNDNNTKDNLFKAFSKFFIYNKKYKNYKELVFSKFLKNFYKFDKLNSLLQNKFKDIYSKYSNMFDKFVIFSDTTKTILNKKALLDVTNEIHNNKLSELLDITSNNTLSNNKIIFFNNLVKKSFKKEISFLKNNQKFLIDTYKYNDIYLSRLNSIISKIYNKKVEFNIIDLKYPYLDTQIFSDSINIKMLNRKSKPIKILKKAWLLPVVNNTKMYKYNVQNIYRKKYNTLDMKNLYTDSKNNTQDILNSILSNIFKVKNIFNSNNMRDKLVYRSIKLRKVGGIKWEAKGRITKRLTASRSVKKMIIKGSLKNIDSSINCLSSVILRGNSYSNLDYLNINSKTRNGSFGLKGWINSK